ncbi:hypothetical protein LCGC14_0853080 [marine sediment metagenome]|uniref:Uncharacterized protein n=1 Tax=marine sediment metagenome TaxID=412755 RepID=A0A0F9RU60_9ZZZZ
MENSDFPCSRLFRGLEAEREGIDLDPCLTQKERDFELWLVATGGPLNEREYEDLMDRKAYLQNQERARTQERYFQDQRNVKDALIEIVSKGGTQRADGTMGGTEL